MSGIVLPHRLAFRQERSSAIPPSLSSLDEKTDRVKRILTYPMLLGGVALGRNSLCRVCDFTCWQSKQRGSGRVQQAYRKPLGQQQRENADQRGPSGQQGRDAGQGQNQGQNQNAQNRQQRIQQNGGKKDKLSAAYQRPQPVNRSAVMRARAVISEFTCPVRDEWIHVQDVSMQFLNGTTLNPKQVVLEDLKFVGQAAEFNRRYDTLVPRDAVDIPLKGLEKVNSFKNPSARGDAELAELLTSQKDVSVIVSDQVVAALMAAPLSRFGWQICAYKFNDKIVLDKASLNNSTLDLLTLNETVPIEQMTDVKQRAFARECAIQQMEFQEFILDGQPVAAYGELIKDDETGEETHIPTFSDEADEEPAIPANDSAATTGQRAAKMIIDDPSLQPPPNRLYRYRYLTLPPGHPIPGHQEDHCRKQPIKIALRAEIHAAQTNENGDIAEYLKIHTLTEGYLKPQPNELNWATGIERQKGSLLLNEMRKNACKITRWIYQAILADANSIKLGFLSRKSDHLKLLTVQSCRVRDLAVQIGLKLGNGYGVLRELLDIILSDTTRPEGRYIITRDSITDNVRIHFAPMELEASDSIE